MGRKKNSRRNVKDRWKVWEKRARGSWSCLDSDTLAPAGAGRHRIRPSFQVAPRTYALVVAVEKIRYLHPASILVKLCSDGPLTATLPGPSGGLLLPQLRSRSQKPPPAASEHVGTRIAKAATQRPIEATPARPPPHRTTTAATASPPRNVCAASAPTTVVRQFKWDTRLKT